MVVLYPSRHRDPTARTHHHSKWYGGHAGYDQKRYTKAITLTKTASISESSKFLTFGRQRCSGASQNSLNIGLPELCPLLELVDGNEKLLYFSRK